MQYEKLIEGYINNYIEFLKKNSEDNDIDFDKTYPNINVDKYMSLFKSQRCNFKLIRNQIENDYLEKVLEVSGLDNPDVYPVIIEKFTMSNSIKAFTHLFDEYCGDDLYLNNYLDSYNAFCKRFREAKSVEDNDLCLKFVAQNSENLICYVEELEYEDDAECEDFRDIVYEKIDRFSDYESLAEYTLNTEEYPDITEKLMDRSSNCRLPFVAGFYKATIEKYGDEDIIDELPDVFKEYKDDPEYDRVLEGMKDYITGDFDLDEIKTSNKSIPLRK